MGDETECAFCGRRSSDPIFILGRSFCQECEERLARLQVDDPDYPVWLDVIRGIWANWAETL